MKICVVGMGHFAEVVASCLWQKGHAITSYDERPFLIRDGQPHGRDEPGWTQPNRTCATALDTSMLWDPAAMDLFWVAYDVPLTLTGAPDPAEILRRVARLDAAVPKAIPFLVSCQWPVGTTRTIAAECPGREFVYVMENVRVGKAVADLNADPLPALGAERLPRGTAWNFIRGMATTKEPWCSSWETIEFSKHSMNAFIALQIAFVNELARLAPPDVNMADVTRVLKSDPRVSPLAPLTAGSKFGGGSLKRDLMVLESLSTDPNQEIAPIIWAIRRSNER
jgi:UDPglucose 6-dehydrogenase